MPTSEHETVQRDNDPLTLIERLKADIEELLKSQLNIEMEGISLGGEVQRPHGGIWRYYRMTVPREIGDKPETEEHLIFGGDDRTLRIYQYDRVLGTASKPDEAEDRLTPEELNQVMDEALKLIDSDGLDSPSGHLEYVRRQLRAAVA
jgi:hypothetical protein